MDAQAVVPQVCSIERTKGTRGEELNTQRIRKVKESRRTNAPPEYKMHFGRCKGKTMSKLYNSEKEADRSYIPWLFAWASPKVQGADLPILRAALEREGPKTAHSFAYPGGAGPTHTLELEGCPQHTGGFLVA